MSQSPEDDWLDGYKSWKTRYETYWDENDEYRPIWSDQEARAADEALNQWLDDRMTAIRVYWDDKTNGWKCHCSQYKLRSRCAHIVRYRPTDTVRVDDKYL